MRSTTASADLNKPLLGSESTSSSTAVVPSAALVAKPKKKKKEAYQPHYPVFYKVVFANNIFWGVPAFKGEFTFGLFSRTYAAIGTTYVLQRTLKPFNISIPDVPEKYGDISSVKNFFQTAHPVAETMGWAAAGSEIVNGVTQFEPASEAKESAVSWDTWVYETNQKGWCTSFRDWGCDSFNSPAAAAKSVYKGLSYGMFVIGAVVTSYGDIEAVKEPFQNWFGETGGNVVIGWLGGGALYYCAKAFLAKVENGMEYLWSGPTHRSRYQNHGSVLIEVQYSLEAVVTCAVRTGSLSFLFGRLGEQWKYHPELCYTVGAAAGFAQGIQLFAPGTHRKYHQYLELLPNGKMPKTESEKNSIVPVIQQERNAAYNAKYVSMSLKDRALTELKRMFFIGVAQSAGSAYLVMTEAGPLISNYLVNKGYPQEFADAVTYTTAIAAAAIAYIPFYKANLYKELNALAYKARAIPPLDSIVVVPNEEPEVPADSLVIPTEDDLPSDSLVVPTPLKTTTPVADEKSSVAVVNDTTTIKDTTKVDGTPAASAPATDKIADEKAVISAGDTTRAVPPLDPEINEEDEEEEEEEELRPSCCATFIGTTASLLSQFTRIPAFIASLARNQLIGHELPLDDWLALGGTAGTIVGDNRFQVMTQSSVDSIAKLPGCGTKVSKTSMFSAPRPSAHSSVPAPGSVPAAKTFEYTPVPATAPASPTSPAKKAS